MDEPLRATDARRVFRKIVREGDLIISSHAWDEMEDDDLSEIDVVNMVRAGVVREPEFENGSWRYRIETQRMAVVVALRGDAALVVVTAWRIRR